MLLSNLAFKKQVKMMKKPLFCIIHQMYTALISQWMQMNFKITLTVSIIMSKWMQRDWNSRKNQLKRKKMESWSFKNSWWKNIRISKKSRKAELRWKRMDKTQVSLRFWESQAKLQLLTILQIFMKVVNWGMPTTPLTVLSRVVYFQMTHPTGRLIVVVLYRRGVKSLMIRRRKCTWKWEVESLLRRKSCKRIEMLIRKTLKILWMTKLQMKLRSGRSLGIW